MIPTYYNNNAKITADVSLNGSPLTTLVFSVDNLLEPPTVTEADMTDNVYYSISSDLQNVNMVLMNLGKSISTI